MDPNRQSSTLTSVKLFPRLATKPTRNVVQLAKRRKNATSKRHACRETATLGATKCELRLLRMILENEGTPQTEPHAS